MYEKKILPYVKSACWQLASHTQSISLAQTSDYQDPTLFYGTVQTKIILII
jgi:hypothetical protein